VQQLSAARPWPTTRSLGRQPVLDGLRGLAWFAVFMGHAGLVPELAAGQVAMFVFFGLSGFLITAILASERGNTGRISLTKFFARRTLRLVPALFAFLMVWLTMVAICGHESWMTTVPGSTSGGSSEPMSVALEGVGAGLSYLTNWCGLFGIFTGYVPLGHLWSLAVEEQFYLVWAPLLVLLVVRGRRFAAFGAALLATASFIDVIWIHHAHSTTAWVFYSTDSRSGAFLVGAAVALLWTRRDTVATWWRRACTPLAIVAMALMVWSGWVFDHRVSPVVYAVSWIAVSVSAPVMVVALIDRHRARPSWLSTPVVTYIGRRLYGLYLWHYVWLTWLHDLGLSGVVIALFATLCCAELSWRLVESPFLRLKSRFMPSEESPGAERIADEPDRPSVRVLAGASASIG
jgi:peptidoglycan/LPS O-acetylase OafA/YrhL